MHDIDLTFDSAGHRFVGTLTLPEGDGPFPAALLLPGSGPVDRDSDHRRLPLKVTRELAEALAAAGIATYRYDKRGVGASTGEFLATGFLEGMTDAAAALAALRSRPEIDPSRVAVAGHSEGALIAANLAATVEPPREPGSGDGDGPGAGSGAGTAARPVVAAVVLLSPSAKPGAETLRWQAERLAPSMPAAVRWLLRLTRTDLVTKVLKNHERIRRTTTDVARIGGVRINARWTREFLDHDPAADLGGIHAPVLAVTGEKDLQVDPADLARVAESVPGPVETHVIPDLDHILRRQPGPPSLRAYRREAREPVDAQVKAIVTGWLTERLSPDARS
ncbi:alpha/beta fold hydrolase [Microbispora triticiradicis]|uniref:Alpha/beta fold hydrolase n=1 Tax=Microbispora triticiradicis TaxID=2200763 RepID=A0ABX9LIL0_9ACTN|nr:alpha/beta fold hydrolase [Microbispora triticiradicis]RGA03528.1 alpha/beta fold hydrolase [Microbispora triticiradicis]GLW25149.1 acyl-CoA thioester hydrolase [Microbispora amethystogenes]